MRYLAAVALMAISAPAIANEEGHHSPARNAAVSDMCWDAANPHWFRCSDDPAMNAFVKKHSRHKRPKRAHG